jgi:hypothetical protein
VKRAVAAFPAASFAVHVTTVSPIAKALPAAGERASVGDGSTSSFAEAA